MARIERIDGNITIIDVAREAGVSYATVSRVLNNKAHVKPEKRAAVLAAMERLGYVVNQQARGLASGRSRIVGLVVQNLVTSWIGLIVRGIDEEVAAAQYGMMLYTTHHRKFAETSYVSAMARGLADGLLLIIPLNPSAYVETLQRQRFPYVLLDHYGVDTIGSSVGVTNLEGAYHAVKYLIELGHRRIGFITGNLKMASSHDRIAGYRNALQDVGIVFDPALVVEGDFVQQSGFIGCQQLLRLPERPTAIFASNDMMAFGAMDAARDHGLRLPDDLSVLGFDDIPEASNVYPALTTVRQPLEQMGRMATRLLLEAIEHPEQPYQRIILPTELIIRRSCQPPQV